MRRSILAAVAIAAACSPPTPIPFEVVYSKPTAPIDLELSFDPAPVPGRRVQLNIFSRTKLEADLSVQIKFPDGVTHIDGPPSWKGKSPANLAIGLAVRDTARRLEISVIATAVFPDGTRMARAAAVLLNSDKPAPEDPKGRIRDGVIEFKQ